MKPPNKDLIFTDVSLQGNWKSKNNYQGHKTQKDFTLMWLLLDIIWQPDFEKRKYAKRALKKIRLIVDEYDKSLDKI